MTARYSVDLTTTADKELSRIRRGQPRDAERLEDAMVALSEDPHPTGCTPLTGLSGVLRIRVGDYRICYTVDEGVLVVLVLLIRTRDDVYPPAQAASRPVISSAGRRSSPGEIKSRSGFRLRVQEIIALEQHAHAMLCEARLAELLVGSRQLFNGPRDQLGATSMQRH